MKRLLPVVAGLAAFAGQAAAAAELAATQETIQRVWATAKPGDTIRLQGAFGLTVLRERTFDPPVTVDARAGRFSAVILRNVTGVNWRGGAFTPIDNRPGITVGDSQKVRVEGMDFRGTGVAAGAFLANSRDVELARSRFDRPRNGVTAQNVVGLRIIENTITGWSADGLGLEANANGVIKGNTFADPIRIDPSIHIDAIQGYYAAKPNRDLLIAENRIRGADTQGIFMPQDLRYPPSERIRIVGNIVETADAPNGILLQGDPAGEVSGNRVTTLPGSKWQTVIQVKDVTRQPCGNSVEAYKSWRANTERACK